MYTICFVYKQPGDDHFQWDGGYATQTKFGNPGIEIDHDEGKELTFENLHYSALDNWGSRMSQEQDQ